MIDCLICGRPLQGNNGNVYAVLDGFVAVHAGECYSVLCSRVRRLMADVRDEFKDAQRGRREEREEATR